MPDKLMRLRRSESVPESPRPVMLAIAGDSAAGKTTLTRGIAEALGADRAVHAQSLRELHVGRALCEEQLRLVDPARELLLIQTGAERRVEDADTHLFTSK